jgi:hypothetical protein
MEDLYKRFIEQTGMKFGAANDKDVNKQLEKDLCAEFFKTDKIEEPPKEMDFKGIDVIVDGVTVQVKCHANKDFILEDKKLNKADKWIKGNIDRCDAKLFLNVFPENGKLVYELFDTSEVKEMLDICRSFQERRKINWTPEKSKIFAKFGSNPGYYQETKNKRSFIFRIKR